MFVWWQLMSHLFLSAVDIEALNVWLSHISLHEISKKKRNIRKTSSQSKPQRDCVSYALAKAIRNISFYFLRRINSWNERNQLDIAKDKERWRTDIDWNGVYTRSMANKITWQWPTATLLTFISLRLARSLIRFGRFMLFNDHHWKFQCTHKTF